MSVSKLFATTALVALLALGSTAATAASPNRNVPSNTGIEKAAANAANAGINLLNTIKSDAGKGNGPEVAVSGVSTVNVASSTVDTDKTTVLGAPSSTTTTNTDVSKGPLSDWTRVDQGRAFVYKIYQDVTTTTTTTETTVTPQTEVTTVTTTNYETPVTTTTFEELDPGKSAPKNNSPEEGAPAPDVVTGDTVQVGDPVVVETSVDLDPIVDSDIIDTSTETETATVDVCNPSTPNGCPF
ncbi:MAG: hypothetical protein ACAH80_04055 [Alphaproteobacteria bacterium]